jgi:predicted amidohydrolase
MLRISAVQFLVLKDPAANLAKAERFIKEESKGADLIVFPEYFIGSKAEDSAAVVKRFCGLAKRYDVDIVAGSMLTKRGGRSYNTSTYIDSGGKVLARYDKVQLWKSERVTPGGLPKPFKTRFGRTALIICWDLSSPSVSAHLSKSGVDLIICPAMWWEGSEAQAGKRFAGRFIDSLCGARAYECRAAVVYSNAAGRISLSGGFYDMSAGRSQIHAPMRRPSMASGSGEQVVRSGFDKKRIIQAKRYFDGKV